ncbi:DeoR/GlpR family DNA-binding transcription regulator [Tundrisphaera sp. TA3]|uniref:DeoR/GlpR family DNA-binding transcription regulator n=1 Tax=Tundrisphaera sp. TA3 TaxID=3435775 RepID=UPI003EB88D4C
MLTSERRLAILDRLHRDGKVVASELSRVLGVSLDTVRRDLRELDEEGSLQRVHGGALPRSRTPVLYAARARIAPEAKESIARAAARLIQDGQVVFLDSGTTAAQVARHLAPGLRASFITPSPIVAAVLAEHPLIEVALLGGNLDKETLSVIGADVVDALRRVRADLCLLGVCCLHPEFGVSVPGREEAAVKRAMVEGAAEVVALASAEKLGTIEHHAVASLIEITHLVTEANTSEAILAPYRASGISVLFGDEIHP